MLRHLILANKYQYSALKLLRPYILRYKLLNIGAFCAILIASITMLLLPVIVRNLLDQNWHQNANFGKIYFFYLLALAFLLAISSALRYFCVVIVGEKIIIDLKKDIFSHLLKLPASFFDRVSAGEIAASLTADATQIKDVIASVCSVALRNLLMAIGGLVMMFITNGYLAFLVVAIVPFIIAILLYFAHRLRSQSKLAQQKNAVANAMAGESIAGVKTIRAFGAENVIFNKFALLLSEAYTCSLTSVFSRALLTAFAIFIVFATIIAVLYIGVLQVCSNQLSSGNLGQFVLYSIFTAGAFAQLSEAFTQISQALGALERLAQLRNEETIALNLAKRDMKFTDSIVFDELSFSYPRQKNVLILDNLSLRINKGEKVAFVGASGAGKSTIFALLLGFYEAKSGKILIDGQDLAGFDYSAWLEKIAYVPQDIFIFKGTIYENIIFACKTASFEDVVMATKSADIYDFIMSLPQAFETQIGSGALSLSGGQRQRIAIARAFLKKAPILLLDEASSALDAQSEAKIHQALEKLMQNCTTLIIAHRLSSVVNCDRIFVMDKGKVKEQGNHNELMSKNGAYARLVELQFQIKNN